MLQNTGKTMGFKKIIVYENHGLPMWGRGGKPYLNHKPLAIINVRKNAIHNYHNVLAVDKYLIVNYVLTISRI